MHPKRSSSATKVLSLALVTILILVALPVPSAFAAADIIVSTRADQVIIDGECSLREAVINANTDSNTNPDCEAGTGKDTIYLRAGLTYRLNQGSLDITDSDGLIFKIRRGTAPATINARGYSRALYVKDTAGDLTLNSIIVQNGFSAIGSGIRFSSSGALTLVDSTVSDNIATASGNCGAGWHGNGHFIFVFLNPVSHQNTPGEKLLGLYKSFEPLFSNLKSFHEIFSGHCRYTVPHPFVDVFGGLLIKLFG